MNQYEPTTASKLSVENSNRVASAFINRASGTLRRASSICRAEITSPGYFEAFREHPRQRHARAASKIEHSGARGTALSQDRHPGLRSLAMLLGTPFEVALGDAI